MGAPCPASCRLRVWNRAVAWSLLSPQVAGTAVHRWQSAATVLVRAGGPSVTWAPPQRTRAASRTRRGHALGRAVSEAYPVRLPALQRGGGESDPVTPEELDRLDTRARLGVTLDTNSAANLLG